jgi:hypothetical protein
MSEEKWDRVLGDIFAALDRDAAAEGQLIAIAPLLSDEQILRAWAYLAHDDTLRWRARSALAHEALQRVVGRSEHTGRGTAAVRQLAATLGVEPGRVYRLAQIHGVIAGGGVDAGIVEVLPEMAWYDEALAAPDPVAALGYAADQVTAGRPYSPTDFRRDVRKVVAARGQPARDRPPSPQVRLRVTRRDGSRWPAAEAMAFDLVDIAVIEVETPWGRAVLAIDGQGHISADVQQEG